MASFWLAVPAGVLMLARFAVQGGASGAGGAALSATARVAVSLVPGVLGAVVAAVAAGSVAAGSGRADGVGGRGSVLVSGAMPPWYTRYSVAPCRPVDEPIAGFGLRGPDPDAAGRERPLRAPRGAEQAGSGTWPIRAPKTVSTPSRPQPAIFSTFSAAWPTANRSLTVGWSEKAGWWAMLGHRFSSSSLSRSDRTDLPQQALRRISA